MDIGDYMGLVNQIRNYLLEEEFTMEVTKEQVHVANYTSIGHFDSNRVSIRYEKGELCIKGERLVINRLMKDEVLVTGNIESIELR